ncbi:MAG: PKD domain-containing protein [Bacteroidia bacterium]
MKFLMWRRILYIFAIHLFFYTNGFSTHIVGGELFYDNLGGDNYRITLKIYRDCSSATPYDNPGSVIIYDASGNYIQTVEIAFPGSTNVPDSINNPCIQPPSVTCVEEAIYVSTVNLPAKTGGYYLVYQRCCRNGTILNLVNPGAVGSTYMEHIPGPEQVAANNSPRFNKRPKKYICNGFDVDFDHSATDPDGDSLVYSFTSPFTGLSACCPMLGAAAAPGGGALCPVPPSSCPTVGNAPPYATVPFSAPYTGAYPVSSNPALAIDPSTGYITGTPNINGQWVVGVCVREYRNGVLIGIHIRDFQYNVTSCTPLVVSAIAQQTVNCFGFTVGFQNQSVNTTGNPTTYYWNFGDPSTFADTSHFTSPSYTYPDSGKYVVTLIVNKGQACTDTARQTFLIYPLLNPDFGYTSSNACVSDNSFTFTPGGYFAPYSTFSWNFGTAATPQTSTAQNPPPVSFNSLGAFPVTLTVKESVCTAAYIDTVMVYNYPQASFVTDPVIGCEPLSVFFTDNSLHGTPLSYLWNFGDGQSSALADPVHIYSDSGVYNVSLTIISLSGCKDTSTFSVPGMVSVKPAPEAAIFANPVVTDIFNSTISLADSSKDAVSMTLSTGDGNSYLYVPTEHYYEDYGNYTITQIATGSNGCPDTAIVHITILPEYIIWIPNAFSPHTKDELNDVFKPVMMGVVDYTLYIFDRWGNELFKTSELERGWDGTYKGKICEEGVYVYKLEYKDAIEYIYREKTGRVTLVR